MPGNHRRFFRRELPFDDMQIRAADATDLYAHKYLARAGLRLGQVAKFEGVGFNSCRCAEETGLHN
jgi:hypothetical protein